MQSNLDTVVRYLFQQEELSRVPVETLRAFVEAHPYSAAGRYLLTRKLRDEHSEDFESEIETSVLYYNNPLWLQFLLEDGADQAKAARPEIPLQPDEAEPLSDEKVAVADNEPAAPVQLEKEKGDVLPPEEASSLKAEAEPADPEPAIPVPPQAEDPKPAQALAAPSPAGQEPLFEPYHTIDYFASQGIRLRPDDLDKDSFGKQLKSFTEWLKSMKRLTPADLAQASSLDKELAENVQVLAGHSIEGGDVETEAMAEVWIKQGNKAKALAIYEKLSLQNPAKSHYFAAKIEQLKA